MRKLRIFPYSVFAVLRSGDSNAEINDKGRIYIEIIKEFLVF